MVRLNEPKQAVSVLFESNIRIAGEAFWIGMESSQEALHLAANLLIPGQPLVSHPNLTPLGLHLHRTPAPPGAPTHETARGARRFIRW